MKFETIWEGFIGVAKHIPYQHHGQTLLVKVIQILVTVEPWTDLPILGRCMRDNWIGAHDLSHVWIITF